MRRLKPVDFNSPQSDVQIYCNLNQIPDFEEISKHILNFTWKYKRPNTSKTITKKNKVGRLTLPGIKAHYKDTELWQWNAKKKKNRRKWSFQKEIYMYSDTWFVAKLMLRSSGEGTAPPVKRYWVKWLSTWERKYQLFILYSECRASKPHSHAFPFLPIELYTFQNSIVCSHKCFSNLTC